jgi:CBS domain-containing protein
MSHPLITIDPDADFSHAPQLMREHNIRKLVVVKDDIIYGILTAKVIAQRCQDYVDRSVKDIIRWTAALDF